MHDRSDLQGFMKENGWDISSRMNTGHRQGATFVDCDRYMKPLRGGVCLWPSLQVNGHKGEFLFSSLL